jgi:hypothetical protein
MIRIIMKASTVPSAAPLAPGGFLLQFALPKGVTAASAPEPLDARVQLRRVLPARFAVIRYSGLWSSSNYNEHLAQLQAALHAAQTEGSHLSSALTS